ncbi:MAG: S8 family serine peptidase [Cytophagales bacterium]|nr:S8 family serine peptidase [Cytophagales bacterium]
MKRFCFVLITLVAGASRIYSQDSLSTNAQKLKDELSTRQTRISELRSELNSRKTGRQSRITQFRNNHRNQRIANIQYGTDGTVIQLYDIENGIPVYRTTHNENSAETIGTDLIRPGGGLGFDLDGSNAPTIGIWDGDAVRASHVELTGRVTQQDGETSLNDHATHVAGTMIASGVDPTAMGMAPNASIDSYDWDNDNSEMLDSYLKLSNHSYGFIRGWDGTTWRGDGAVSQAEDFQFGRYNENSRAWDDIAYTNYNHLIVTSAGNDRNDNGVAGSVHLPDGDWDCIADYGVSKNVLTVGAVNDIAGGYSGEASVISANFSSWGPVDDGRIKPDIVANGVILRSSTAGSDNAYSSFSGTSMSAPSVTGSLALLHELDNDLFTTYEGWSSTFKGVIIHSADEAGNFDGPDYSFGWGLMNTAMAAEIIRYNDEGCGVRALSLNNGLRNNIRELRIDNGETIEYEIVKPEGVPLKVTLVWTDPAGDVGARALDDRTSALVNDIDLRVISSNGTTFFPWRLNPNNPAAAATTGDNNVDNVEQILIDDLAAGNYTIQLNMETSSRDDSEYVSLIVTGNDRLQQDIYIAPGTEPNIDRVVSGDAWWEKAYIKVRNSLIIDDQYTIEHDGEATFFASTTTLKPGFHAKAGSTLNISTNLDCEVPTQTTSLASSRSGARFTENVNNEIAHASTILKDELNGQLKIYPNPVEGLITLEFGLDQEINVKNISITSLQGHILMEKTQEIQKTEIIDLSTFTRGIYIVNIFLKDGSKVTRQIIKE